MSYFVATLLAAILFLMLYGKRKLDSVYALLKEFKNERDIRLREQEVETLLKQFATK